MQNLAVFFQTIYSMELRRVVVTGLGALSPIGNDVKSTWSAMLAAKSGATAITHFDATLFKTQFACELKNFVADTMFDKKELRKLDPYVQYAMFATDEALTDSGLNMEEEDSWRMGCVWGSAIGGLRSFEECVAENMNGDSIPHFSPFSLPKVISNIAAGQISIRFGLRGPNYVVNSACASSSHAIIDSFNLIRLGKADVMLAGGSEAVIEYTGVGGFSALHALSTRNSSPETASRPFSKSRDGFVLGEGAAALVLEDYEHAVRRGAKIYAELVGAAMNADAFHMTAPEPEGNGVARVMRWAIEDAGMNMEDVDYINAHGTSTPLGDIAEIKGIMSAFGEHAYKMNISSTKSMTGHLLGAAGAIEAVATVLAVKNDVVPPTINHAEDDRDEQIPEQLNLTFNEKQCRTVNCAMSNTFGFGGHNASIVFRKYK